MPKKATGTQAKANVKGGATATNATAADGGSQILANQIAAGGATATAARGAASTRGAKRRRTSNNVNSSSAGTEIYGSGTIVASNPFDDDNHLPISATNHNLAANNKIMMTQTAVQANHQLNMHSSMQQQHIHHHHHQHQTPAHHLHLAHPQSQHHALHQQHHQHQQLHHQHQHHHQQMYSHPHHQNNHNYQHNMQQSMMLQQPPSHGQIGTSPNHMPPGPHPQQIQQQQMHSEHLGVGPQQPSQMHNHGSLMMTPQLYGAPPPPPTHHPLNHPNHQQLHQSQQPSHQQQQQQPQHNPHQQPQMIGTSTPPIIMSGPAPTHSPYNSMIQQGHMMTHPTQVPPQSQQLLPPPHHQQVDALAMQQQPLAATNQTGFCGKCQREVYSNEPQIVCKASCKSCFHVSCSGLTQLACDLLMKEALAEWVCDRCMTGNRRVPYIKYKT